MSFYYYVSPDYVTVELDRGLVKVFLIKTSHKLGWSDDCNLSFLKKVDVFWNQNDKIIKYIAFEGNIGEGGVVYLWDKMMRQYHFIDPDTFCILGGVLAGDRRERMAVNCQSLSMPSSEFQINRVDGEGICSLNPYYTLVTGIDRRSTDNNRNVKSKNLIDFLQNKLNRFQEFYVSGEHHQYKLYLHSPTKSGLVIAKMHYPRSFLLSAHPEHTHINQIMSNEDFD